MRARIRRSVPPRRGRKSNEASWTKTSSTLELRGEVSDCVAARGGCYECDWPTRQKDHRVRAGVQVEQLIVLSERCADRGLQRGHQAAQLGHLAEA
eukprot:scaffold270781_cov31-Tisochrysis_lutea.AAC.3